MEEEINHKYALYVEINSKKYMLASSTHLNGIHDVVADIQHDIEHHKLYEALMKELGIDEIILLIDEIENIPDLIQLH